MPSKKPKTAVSLPSPRDRLLAHGPHVLSDEELLALILRTGSRGSPATDLSRTVLERLQGLGGFVGKTASEWVSEPGIGPARGALLLATMEVARRIARSRLEVREPMQQPDAVARYLTLRYSRRDQEVVGSLYLDGRNRLLAEGEVFRGTLSRAAVEPRAILKRALLESAAGLILFHTHPSGDPTPSAEDLAFTRRIADAGDVLGVRLVDHLVLGGPGQWVSLARRGGW